METYLNIELGSLRNLSTALANELKNQHMCALGCIEKSYILDANQETDIESFWTNLIKNYRQSYLPSKK